MDVTLSCAISSTILFIIPIVLMTIGFDLVVELQLIKNMARRHNNKYLIFSILINLKILFKLFVNLPYFDKIILNLFAEFELYLKLSSA